LRDALRALPLLLQADVRADGQADDPAGGPEDDPVCDLPIREDVHGGAALLLRLHRCCPCRCLRHAAPRDGAPGH